mmetsp:Transcript_99415/g.310343  ORF Transcript_99415/g.310343 Transcript_99415/m.310343 type:complete len:339 (+) Transcript_99415:1913-2929(+)
MLVVVLVLRGVHPGHHVPLCPLEPLPWPTGLEEALIADLQAPPLRGGHAAGSLGHDGKILVVEKIGAVQEGTMPGVCHVLDPTLLLWVFIEVFINVEAGVGHLNDKIRTRHRVGEKPLDIPAHRPRQLASGGAHASLLASVVLGVHRAHPLPWEVVQDSLVVRLHVLEFFEPLLYPLHQGFPVGRAGWLSRPGDLAHGVAEAREDVGPAARGQPVLTGNHVRPQHDHDTRARGQLLRPRGILFLEEGQLQLARVRSQEEEHHEAVLRKGAQPHGRILLRERLRGMLILACLVEQTDTSCAGFSPKCRQVLHESHGKLRDELVQLAHCYAVQLNGVLPH